MISGGLAPDSIARAREMMNIVGMSGTALIVLRYRVRPARLGNGVSDRRRDGWKTTRGS